MIPDAWIIPILGGLAKAILPSIISGVAGYGVSQLTGGTTSTALVPVGQTPTEASRRALARQQYGPQGFLGRIEGQFDGFRPRRMNVLNPRALSRSIRRVKGFSKFAQRVGSYTQPGKRYRLKGFARKRTGAHAH